MPLSPKQDRETIAPVVFTNIIFNCDQENITPAKIETLEPYISDDEESNNYIGTNRSTAIGSSGEAHIFFSQDQLRKICECSKLMVRIYGNSGINDLRSSEENKIQTLCRLFYYEVFSDENYRTLAEKQRKIDSSPEYSGLYWEDKLDRATERTKKQNSNYLSRGSQNVEDIHTTKDFVEIYFDPFKDSTRIVSKYTVTWNYQGAYVALYLHRYQDGDQDLIYFSIESVNKQNNSDVGHSVNQLNKPKEKQNYIYPSTPNPRKVGILLGLGIFLFPIIFVWFTLRKGHSKKARVLSFGWLIFCFLIALSGG